MSDQFKSGFVALVGRPNVGKSTLLNRLVGQKVAIMSDKPQTTRHKIHSVVTRPDAQVIFLDTPGIHKPRHRLGEYMVEVALGALKEVDVVFFLVECKEPGPGDGYITGQLKGLATPVFLVMNKIDLVEKDTLLSLIEIYRHMYSFAEIIPVSALTGDNLPRLMDLVVGYLPAGPKYYPDEMITDRPERFIMAELIREKVLHLTSQEVPHSVAVVVEAVEEKKNGLVVVRAVIYTERESQKRILIGRGGQMLKEVGRQARQEIEALLGSRIFLDLWVKVRPDWRNRTAALHDLGYSLH
ncbi:GTPase Era [Desulfotomaculum copahuensis]|uniref:GTPase Era n=1 Tax=Desulfotomaculum copahuensis TaxID=1838280 RepID=A0A1B7LHM4_9FIRM|nr:GTPase Era [Desulfotomaculum copahuensis]OAT85789.1 GTPase Era [Desulfotomaculum copahuensis]